MSRYHLTDGAEAELADILNWSEDRFGPAARDRYAALVLSALRNIADDPQQANVHWRRIGDAEIGICHLANSRRRVPVDDGRVAEPRHHVILKIGADNIVEILGFVHEKMLLSRAFRRLLER